MFMLFHIGVFRVFVFSFDCHTYLQCTTHAHSLLTSMQLQKNNHTHLKTNVRPNKSHLRLGRTSVRFSNDFNESFQRG